MPRGLAPSLLTEQTPHSMIFAVFGRPGEKTLATLQTLVTYCKSNKHQLWIHKFLLEEDTSRFPGCTIYDKTHDFSPVELAISLGGDGTFIRLSRMVAPFNVPVLGVNTGRLGFLADISSDEMLQTLDKYVVCDCLLEERSLLQLDSTNDYFKNANLAVNEISILRRDTSSLLMVKLYADGHFINNYWADGLIISTPTGSTAYSMASGGPIVAPDNHCLVVTPISPHSLTVRPLIIKDDVTLTIEVESRADNYMASIDSRSEVVNTGERLIIKKSPYTLKVVKDKTQDYYSTLREKLMWGKDKRKF